MKYIYLMQTNLQGFISIMKHFALERIAEKKPWFVIDFCQLGFIGKMFNSVELPWLVEFFLMFYNDKPGSKKSIHIFNCKIFRRNTALYHVLAGVSII